MKLRLYHTQYYHREVATAGWGSKPFVSKAYFSITLFNKVVLKTTRLLLAFGQKKPFLSLLILSKVHQQRTCSWGERDPVPSRYVQKEKKADQDERDVCAFSFSSFFPYSLFHFAREAGWVSGRPLACYLLTSSGPKSSSECYSVCLNLGSVIIRDFLCTRWTTSFNILQDLIKEHSTSSFKELKPARFLAPSFLLASEAW